MAKIVTSSWIVYKGAFLPAGTHQIDDKDVEAMRPYGKIIEASKATKKTKAPESDPLA